jgi:hypothetical protein
VQTDRAILINKPDIIIGDNEKRTCTLIDVISGDRNVINKETEKILNYQDLTIEIQRMWNVKTEVIPVIIGATGTISEAFKNYVSNIPGYYEVKELQKTAYTGHCTHNSESANVDRVDAGTNDLRTMNNYIRIAATQCCLGTRFVSRIYV